MIFESRKGNISNILKRKLKFVPVLNLISFYSPTMSQTPNRIQVFKSSCSIKKMLQKTLKHGNRGTKGTLKEILIVESVGCRAIAIIAKIIAAPADEARIMSAFVKSKNVRRQPKTVASTQNATTRIFVSEDDNCDGLSEDR